ncbi:tripartite tricarboxylate transporter substrate binding protein [Comamonas aquatilis]
MLPTRSVKFTLRLSALLMAAGLGTNLVQAAEPAWPAARPIILTVPFSAGGSVDVTARLIAQKLGERLHQSVVIDNVAGAGGALGVNKGVHAAADGYNLIMGADSPIAIAKLVNPAAVRYDALKDLAPVAMVNTAPMILVARANLPANNLQELTALAQKQPDKISYATSGIGTILHLAMARISDRAQMKLVHVPYRGGGQIVTDVVGGQVDLAMLISVTAMPQIQSGKLKALAVTSAARLPELPNVPTVAETAALKGYQMVSWAGIFAPARTPAPIIGKLNQELNAVLASPEVKAKLAEQGAVAASGKDSAADFGQFVRKEQARYAEIVKSAHITAE